MLNVFVVNTPFQLYVVRKVIKQYFPLNRCVIVSTIKNNTYDDVVNITRGLKGVWKTKKVLGLIKRNINVVSFFVPHLGNLFSSRFFDLSIKYNRPLSVYYEGVAMFYNPVIANSKIRKKRALCAFLLGFKYHHYEELYPESLFKKATTCYSPTDVLLGNKYKNVSIVNMGEMDCCCNKGSDVLLLTSDTATIEEIDDCIKDIASIIDDTCQKLYIKPHYAIDEKSISLFVEKANLLGNLDVVLLEKTLPIEELYWNIHFEYVISQHFSSALLNMHFIFGNEFKCIVTRKDTIPYDIVKKLDIHIL